MANMIYLALLFSITTARSFFPITINDLPLAKVSQLNEACGYNPTLDVTIMCVDGLECTDMLGGICQPHHKISELYGEDFELDDFFSCQDHRLDVLNVLGDHSHLSAETIWLPECQEDNQKLYKKHQCNLQQFDAKRNQRKKVRCFRVDEVTGEEL